MLDRFFIAIHWAVFLYALILPTSFVPYPYIEFIVKEYIEFLIPGNPFSSLLPYAVFIIVLWIIKGKFILLPWKHGR